MLRRLLEPKMSETAPACPPFDPVGHRDPLFAGRPELELLGQLRLLAEPVA
jgi:hypothetical protein